MRLLARPEEDIQRTKETSVLSGDEGKKASVKKESDFILLRGIDRVTVLLFVAMFTKRSQKL